MDPKMTKKKSVLITSGSKRLGKYISKFYVINNWDLIIHYNKSKQEAEETAHELSSYSNNITLYGYHDPKKMGKIYNSASALIITLDDNLGLNLTLPSRLQTFLYYGKPIIGAANGQTKYIIKTSKSGLCGPSNNHKELLSVANEMLHQNKDKK